MTTRDVTFSGENDRSLVPCLTRGQLASMGVNTHPLKGSALWHPMPAYR
jgi:outer membrane usher protein